MAAIRPALEKSSVRLRDAINPLAKLLQLRFLFAAELGRRFGVKWKAGHNNFHDDALSRLCRQNAGQKIRGDIEDRGHWLVGPDGSWDSSALRGGALDQSRCLDQPLGWLAAETVVGPAIRRSNATLGTLSSFPNLI